MLRTLPFPLIPEAGFWGLRAAAWRLMPGRRAMYVRVRVVYSPFSDVLGVSSFAAELLSTHYFTELGELLLTLFA